MHVRNRRGRVGRVLIDDIRGASVDHELTVHRHVHILYVAVRAEDLPKMILRDVFSELLNDDLGAGRAGARPSRCRTAVETPTSGSTSFPASIATAAPAPTPRWTPAPAAVVRPAATMAVSPTVIVRRRIAADTPGFRHRSRRDGSPWRARA